MDPKIVEKEALEKWPISNSHDIYSIREWGDGYFDIGENGTVVVRPDRKSAEIDLHEIVTSLVQRGIDAPILLRFDGIIRNRIQRLYYAFEAAIEEWGYQNAYQPVYPIKVNQQKHVVDIIRKHGRNFLLGLEVGSKPELVGVLSIHDAKGAVLLCNGYKDREYIELALLSKKIGRRPILIVEQFYELDLILKITEELGIGAEIGFRMKPVAKGSGKWAASGGDLAKFGLNTHEILLLVEKLEKAGKKEWLKLLHFHIGSQITSIVPLKQALKEASRTYTELARMCPALEFFDVGGGLGVDYDGTRTTNDSSMNYTTEEYARDVVYAIKEACTKAKIPMPVIISESGRAIVAQHTVLVTEVIDVAHVPEERAEIEKDPSKHELCEELWELYTQVTCKNCLETLHDANFLKEAAMNRFIQGDLRLEQRAYIERNYQKLLVKIHEIAKKMEFIPEDVERLEEKLLDIYFCNFSVFQSLPDSWAIEQLFPVMPIHRLNEKPSRNAVIVDLSCDSDGTIDLFAHGKEYKNYLPLHAPNDNSYYVGIFLVGAYQEILGGIHNLFGDTNAIHVDVDGEGNLEFSHEIEGNTISDVLQYVQYDESDLQERLRLPIEEGLKAKTLNNVEAAMLKKRFKQALESYTYLVK